MQIIAPLNNGSSKNLSQLAIEATEAFYRAGLISESSYKTSLKAWSK